MQKQHGHADVTALLFPTAACSPGLTTLASAVTVASAVPLIVLPSGSAPAGDAVCVPSVAPSRTAAAAGAAQALYPLVPVGSDSIVVECDGAGTFVHEVSMRYPRVMRPLNGNTVVCIPCEAANSGLSTHYTFHRGRTAADLLWSDSLFFKSLTDHCASSLKHASAVASQAVGGKLSWKQ